MSIPLKCEGESLRAYCPHCKAIHTLKILSVEKDADTHNYFQNEGDKRIVIALECDKHPIDDRETISGRGIVPYNSFTVECTPNPKITQNE